MTTETLPPLFTGEPEPDYDLKYLFEVTYRNGGRYLQSPSDVSPFDPDRNPWSDVLEERIQPLAESVRLTLSGEEAVCVVDLVTGWLELNGQRLWVCPTVRPWSIPAGTRLEPYRGQRVRRRIDAVINLTTGDTRRAATHAPTVLYECGWNAIIGGTAHQARLSLP